jgi:hypothetical protein
VVGAAGHRQVGLVDRDAGDLHGEGS